ncbi:MAG: sugar transferase [Anaerolineae bacterium]
MRARTPPGLWSYGKPIVDALLIAGSFRLAYWVRYDLQWLREVEPAYRVAFGVYRPSILALIAILLCAYWLEGAYRQERGREFFDEFYIVLRGTMMGNAVMIVAVFLSTPNYYSRLIFGYAGVLTLVLLGLARTIERAVIARRRQRGLGVERVLIVGAGEVTRSIMRTVCARPELGYAIEGFVDDDPVKASTSIGRFTALGNTAVVPDLLATHAIDQVIITLPWTAHDQIERVMQQCQAADVSVRIVPDLFQMTMSNVVVDNLDGIPLLGVQEPMLKDYEIVLKRAMDVIIAMVGLVVLSPILILISLAIKLESRGPVIFSQVRVGRNGVQFMCYKFRTMVEDAEALKAELVDRNEASGPFFKIRDDPRRTRMGRFLRRLSLDELPQLWNVFKGEMSLVGPRPNLPAEVMQYQPWHRRRLEVPPGITGLWQVSGRSDLTFDEMVLLDIYYIENWSALFDLRILIKTVPTALIGHGAY